MSDWPNTRSRCGREDKSQSNHNKSNSSRRTEVHIHFSVAPGGNACPGRIDRRDAESEATLHHFIESETILTTDQA